MKTKEQTKETKSEEKELKGIDIYNSLKSVPKEYLKKITGGRLKGMSDIKPQWRLLKLTEQFGLCGFGWKICDLTFEYKNASAEQVICICHLNLHVNVNNQWSDAIPGVGGSSFIVKEKDGLYTSDEAEKMAYTDAISVACKMIGVAGDVYMGHGGKYDKEELTIEHPNYLRAVEYLKTGGSIEQIKTKYEVSKEVEQHLIKSI